MVADAGMTPLERQQLQFTRERAKEAFYAAKAQLRDLEARREQFPAEVYANAKKAFEATLQAKTRSMIALDTRLNNEATVPPNGN